MKHLFLLLVVFTFACGEDVEKTSPPHTRTSENPIEIAGFWRSDAYGSTFFESINIVWASYGLAEIINYDNDGNIAILKENNLFSRVIWTEIENDSFFYCIEVYDKASQQEAEEAVVDPNIYTASTQNGCGGFGFTELKRAPLPYALSIVEFKPGKDAGYNDNHRDVVLGPPKGGGTNAGSLDVLSLGQQGEITLGFGDVVIHDKAGPDFVVYENPFVTPDGTTFSEIGEVSVSEDGVVWKTFACNTVSFLGCAGIKPVVVGYDPYEILPIAVSQTGGDGFDLLDVGLKEAKFVRIKDLSGAGSGFDLDAVGVVHF